MSANVILTPNFEKKAKKLVRKYRSLSNELLELAVALAENPRKGVQIQENIYKIRLAVKSKGKGKSGGLRVINYVEVKVVEIDEQLDVFLLTIYDKSKQESISKNLIEQMLIELLGESQNSSSEENVSLVQEEE